MIEKLPCHDEIVYEIQRAIQKFGPLTAQSLMKRRAQVTASIDVIFVSHFLKNGHHQSHYFDNDNLAIKSILDAIIPLVCVDDATRYCDNFYLSQYDMNEFSELYIVRKGCTKAWAAAHKELDFARAII